MSIIIENEYKGTIDIPYEKIAEEVIAAAIDYENCPYECEVNLLLTDNEEIHRINLEQRQIDRPTDVLSFPMAEYEKPLTGTPRPGTRTERRTSIEFHKQPL